LRVPFNLGRRGVASDDRTCWNAGIRRVPHHRGRCSFAPEGAERCDCPRYEDSEYYGEQRKRDTYTLSDRRRLGLRREKRWLGRAASTLFFGRALRLPLVSSSSGV